MPDSRPERIAFALGLAAILVLTVALIPAYSHYNSSRSSAPAIVPASSAPAKQTSYRPKPTPPASVVQPRRAHQTTRTQAPKKIVPAAKPPVAKPRVAVQAKLTLSAARGDCWVEVRDGSATGKVLDVRTLTKGKSFRLAAPKLWIRLGAPQSVDLVINGHPATIPGGSQDFLVTPKGVTATA